MTLKNWVNEFLLTQKLLFNERVTESKFYNSLKGDPKKFAHFVGWSKKSNGKIHSHQRRIPKTVKSNIETYLFIHFNKIEEITEFNDLLKLLMRVEGIRQLTAYDISVRIGECFGLSPNKVYIHRGAYKGALNLLGNKVKGRNFLYIHELPVEMQVLTPIQAEDFLCIYKDTFLTMKSPTKSCKSKNLINRAYC